MSTTKNKPTLERIETLLKRHHLSPHEAVWILGLAHERAIALARAIESEREPARRAP